MSAEQPHPISLEQVLFVRCSVIAVPGHVPTDGMIDAIPENKIDVLPVDGHPGRYNASMRTVINPKSDLASPYFIDMECMATLTADNTLTPEDALRGVTITAHSVLYGAIRETVAWLTSRQPYGTLMLGLSVLRSSVKSTIPNQ